MAGILGFVGGAVAGTTSGGSGGEAEASPNTQTGEAPNQSSSPDTESPEASPDSGDHTITLNAPTTVPAGERIDLTGSVDPAVEGLVLVVERSRDGGENWQSFPEENPDPVTAEVTADGTFSTWVITGIEGENVWRLVGEVDGEPVVSNEVTVTVQPSSDGDDDDDG